MRAAALADANQAPEGRYKPLPVAAVEILRSEEPRFWSLFCERLPQAAVVSVGLHSSEALMSYPAVAESTGDSMFGWIARIVIGGTPVLLLAVALLTVAHVQIRDRRWRWPAMIVAIVAGASIASALGVTLLPLAALGIPLGWYGYDPLSRFLYSFWQYLAFGTLFGILFEWQRNTERVMRQVRDTAIAGEIAERRMLESRLSSLKARVDPELLFAVVLHAEALYRGNLAAADRLLERLIEFLRASLSHTPEATGKLQNEILLCGAYLELERALRDDALDYRTDIDSGAANSYFPPAVLLPLLQSLLRPIANHRRRVELSLNAERRSSTVRIELTCDSASLPATAPLEFGASALRHFFGENVSVVASPGAPAGTVIGIEVPYVAA